jgi:hypothetical protein
MKGMRIGGLALVLTLSACGKSVTAPEVAPRFDGGHTFGGGFGMDGGGFGAAPPETCDGGDRGGGTYGGGLQPPSHAPLPRPDLTAGAPAAVGVAETGREAPRQHRNGGAFGGRLTRRPRARGGGGGAEVEQNQARGREADRGIPPLVYRSRKR